MRYRPFGVSGAAVSNITLSLGFDALSRGRGGALDLIYSALEAGVNSYALEDADPITAEVLGEALSHVDRKLVCVSLTLGVGEGRQSARDFSAEGLTGAIDRVLHYSGLGWIDVGVLSEPGEQELPQSSLDALKALRRTERVRLLGVSGDGEVMDTYVSTGAFDVLVTPFNLRSGWPVRNRIRAAREQDMAIFAYDYFQDRRQRRDDAPPVKRGLFRFGGGKAPAPEAKTDPYDFLYRTPKWSAEAICLTYALTDPSIASVIVRAHDIERLKELAEAPERDMPPGLAAQIEMARVALHAA